MELDRVGVAIFPVAKGRGNHDSLPLLLPVTRPDLFPDIPGVVVVHQATDTDNQIILIRGGVQTFCDRDHSNPSFPQVIDKQGRLCPVPPQAGEILDEDSVQPAGIHSRRELIQPTAAKVHTAGIIIRRLSYNLVALPLCKGSADLLLIQQGIHFSVVIIG